MAGRLATYMVLAAVLALHATGYATMLTGIKIQSGARGLAVIVDADEPFSQPYSKSFQKNNTVFIVSLKNCAWSGTQASYVDFPQESPVQKIVVNAQKSSVVITFTLSRRIQQEVQARLVNSKILFLLSNGPFIDFVWTSNGSTPQATLRSEASVPVVVPQQVVQQRTVDQGTSPGVVSSIRIMQRGDLEQLIIETDSPNSNSIKDMGNTIIVVLQNAKNGLDKSVYIPPSYSFFKRLTIRNSNGDGVAKVGIVIEKASTSVQACFAQLQPGVVVVYAVHSVPQSAEKLSWWAADLGVAQSYTFRNVPVVVLSEASVANAVVPAKQVKLTRFVVVRDKVNLRSKPASQIPETILRSISMGQTGAILRKQGDWSYLELDNGLERGWVSSAMIAESTIIGQAKWTRLTTSQPLKAATPLNPAEVVAEQAPQGHAAGIENPTFTKPPSLDSAILLQQRNKGLSGIPAYKVFGRDPFIPLTEYKGSEDLLPDVEQSTLVGILYDTKSRIIVLESHGKAQESYSLREGDQVLHGRLQKITMNSAVFLIEDGGIFRQFVQRLKLKNE